MTPTKAVKKEIGLLTDVFRSSKEPEMYIYVPRKDDALEQVPEALLHKFGKPVLALSLNLTPEKKLARSDAKKVLKELEEKGYYLQLPPSSFVNIKILNTHEH